MNKDAQKANILSHKIAQEFDSKEVVGYECAIQMAEWKDEQLENVLGYLQTNNIKEPHLMIMHLRKMLLDK